MGTYVCEVCMQAVLMRSNLGFVCRDNELVRSTQYVHILTGQLKVLAEAVLQGDGADAVQGARHGHRVLAEEVRLSEHVHVVDHEAEQAELGADHSGGGGGDEWHL